MTADNSGAGKVIVQRIKPLLGINEGPNGAVVPRAVLHVIMAEKALFADVCPMLNVAWSGRGRRGGARKQKRRPARVDGCAVGWMLRREGESARGCGGEELGDESVLGAQREVEKENQEGLRDQQEE